MSKRELMELNGLNRYLNYKNIRLFDRTASFFKQDNSEVESQAVHKTDEDLKPSK